MTDARHATPSPSRATVRRRDTAGSRATTPPSLAAIRDHFRTLGLRWTAQRRQILEVLDRTDGHITGAELVDRCRSLDPLTTPSTVYRTLRVFEELGVVRHAHGADGREEYHVRPAVEHGHLHCEGCGASWEIDETEAAATMASLERSRGFAVDLSHLTIVGRCAACQAADPD
ncbi:MAG: Fur family transcriptional regulator [Candidatus Limnocylindrales bacterium]